MRFAEYSRELQRRRPRRVGRVLVEEADSSQTLARRLADDYLRESALPPDVDLVFWRQRLGRGRLDHHWTSPPGAGVYATLVRAFAGREALQTLPLAVAVALAEVCRGHLGDRCGLKWPNDLLVEGGKLGGILIEIVTAPSNAAVALVGFGLNHAADLDAFGEERAVSLRSAGADVGLPELASAALAAVDAAIEEVRGATTASAEQITRRYAALSVHRPGETLNCRVGKELLRGRFLGFAEQGFLRLEIDGEERHLAAGEVLYD